MTARHSRLALLRDRQVAGLQRAFARQPATTLVWKLQSLPPPSQRAPKEVNAQPLCPAATPQVVLERARVMDADVLYHPRWHYQRHTVGRQLATIPPNVLTLSASRPGRRVLLEMEHALGVLVPGAGLHVQG